MHCSRCVLKQINDGCDASYEWKTSLSLCAMSLLFHSVLSTTVAFLTLLVVKYFT